MIRDYLPNFQRVSREEWLQLKFTDRVDQKQLRLLESQLIIGKGPSKAAIRSMR